MRYLSSPRQKNTKSYLPYYHSRCQRFDFRRIKVDVLASRLDYIAKSEGISLEENAAKIIAKQAMGGMRDAISLFELCSSGGHDVTSGRVTEILGLSGTETSYKTAVAVKRKDTAAIFNIVKTVMDSSKDISVYWQELIEFWRDMLVCKYLPASSRMDYLDLTEPEMRVLEDAAKRFDQASLSYHCTVLDSAMREMTRSPQTKRLTAELSLIKMCDPSLETSAEAMSARIAELESKLSMLTAGGAMLVQEKNTANQSVSAEINGDMTEDSIKNTDSSGITEPDSNLNQETAGENGTTDKSSEAENISGELTPIRDLGEIEEKISAANPMYMSFFRDSDCYVSADRKEVTVKTSGKFAVQMLSSDDAKKVISSAFILCGVCDPDAVLKITSGAKLKEKSPVDELTEF